MSGKHLLKLYSYVNQNRNRFLNLSIKPFFKSRNGIKSFVRSITTELSEPNVVKDVKLFKHETASLYYWRYFMNNSFYNPYFQVSNTNSLTENNFQSIKLLSDLANVQCFTEENIKLSAEALNCLEKDVSAYGLEDICQALILMYKCKYFVPEINMTLEKMKKCIDEELCKKYLTQDEILKILSTLNVAQKGFLQYKNRNLYFLVKGSMKLLNKINNLTPQEIVLLFFCAPEKNLKQCDPKYYILSYLSENMSKFNSDEIGIIALGLFKLNLTFSYDKIFFSFTEKVLQEIENIHSIPFRSVCKALQRFIKHSLVPNSLEFQEQLIPHISKLDAQSILEAGLIGIKQNALSESFKNVLVKQLIDNIKNFTFKDFARMLNLTVSCNIQDEALLVSVIKELEARASEEGSLRQNEANLITLMRQFSHHQLYSALLINKLFSIETFNAINRRDFPISGKVSWWSLYCNINLEKPEYFNSQINFSSLRSFQKLNKYLIHVQGNRLEMRNFLFALNNMKKILMNLYGEDKVFLTCALSHYDAGIVLRFNQEMNAESIPEKFKFGSDYFFKRPLKDNNFWVFITLLHFYDFLWQTDSLILSKQTQLRQLKLLGYVPITVKSTEFREAKLDDAERFIKNLIEETLKNLPHKKVMSN